MCRARLIFPEKMDGLALGTQVYRNHDHALPHPLEKSQTERKIRVRFRLAETVKSEPGFVGLALFAQDEDGNEAMVTTPIEKMPAEKPEQALATIEKQLRKLGGTEFECAFVRIDLREVLLHPRVSAQRPAPRRAGRAGPTAAGEFPAPDGWSHPE